MLDFIDSFNIPFIFIKWYQTIFNKEIYKYLKYAVTITILNNLIPRL